MQREEGTILQQGENIIDELDISLSIAKEGKIMQNELELKTKQIGKWVRDRQEQIHLKKLKGNLYMEFSIGKQKNKMQIYRSHLHG